MHTHTHTYRPTHTYTHEQKHKDRAKEIESVQQQGMTLKTIALIGRP